MIMAGYMHCICGNEMRYTVTVFAATNAACVQCALACKEAGGAKSHTLSTLFATTIFTASSTVEYMSTSFIQMSSMLSNVSRRVTSYAAQAGPSRQDWAQYVQSALRNSLFYIHCTRGGAGRFHNQRSDKRFGYLIVRKSQRRGSM